MSIDQQISEITIDTSKTGNEGSDLRMKVVLKDEHGRTGVLFDQEILIGDVLDLIFKKGGGIRLSDLFNVGSN